MNAGMHRNAHRALAEKAARDIETCLAEYQAEYRVRVWGDPPTISVQLSIGAAHYLLDQITHDEVASR